MNTINVGNIAFSSKPKQILCMGSASNKKTGMSGPAFKSLSRYRPQDTMNNRAKYGTQSLLLDHLLINNSINALEGTDATGKAVIYMEYQGSSTKRKAICDGDIIRWEQEVPTSNSIKILPLVLYAISKNTDLDETKNAFINCINDYYSPLQMVDDANMLLFNDSIYYGFFKGKTVVEDDTLDINEIKRGITMGLLTPMEILKDNVTILMPLEVLQIQNSSTVSNEIKKDIKFDIFEKCLHGEYQLSYNWNDRQKNKIPRLKTLESYIPCDEFYSVLRKITYRLNKVISRIDANITGVDAIGDDYVNIFIVGRPGTGKTTLAYMVGAATGMPVYSVNMDKNVDDNEFEGKTKIVDGSFNFVTTDFLDAYTNGGIIILEEVNLADPNVIMGTLGQAVEYPFRLKRNGYEEVRRHPMCVIINTMNVGTVGSRDISEAYADRSKQIYVLNDTKKDDYINILMQKGYQKEVCEWVYDVYVRIQNYLKNPKEPREEYLLLIGLRSSIGALQNIEEGEDPKTAIKNSLAGKLALVDLDVYEDILKNVVDVMPDLII